jgi:hypothetical protein
MSSEVLQQRSVVADERRLSLRRRLLRTLALLVTLAGTAASLGSCGWPTSVLTGPASGRGARALAPDGTFVTVDGHQSSVARLRGRPVLLWFVAGGCASCAVSIPAVAQHLNQLSKEGVQVMALGLAGDFGPPGQALANLEQFARAAAGPAFGDRGWTWGMATESLSRAYDPSGTPDVYYLLTPDGHIWYRNSVPVSTMPALLHQAQVLAGRGRG